MTADANGKGILSTHLTVSKPIGKRDWQLLYTPSSISGQSRRGLSFVCEALSKFDSPCCERPFATCAESPYQALPDVLVL